MNRLRYNWRAINSFLMTLLDFYLVAVVDGPIDGGGRGDDHKLNTMLAWPARLKE